MFVHCIFSSVLKFKRTGSRSCKQILYVYNQYDGLRHVPVVLCTKLGGWSESTMKSLLDLHRYLRNRKTYLCFFCPENSKINLQSNTVILREIVGDLYDMTYWGCGIITLGVAFFT